MAVLSSAGLLLAAAVLLGEPALAGAVTGVIFALTMLGFERYRQRR